MALDISTVFDRLYYVGFLHNGVSGELFDITPSFLTNRVMKVLLNGYGSRSIQINVGTYVVSYLYLLGVISSHVGINDDETTIYSCLSPTGSANKTCQLVPNRTLISG